ncbi:hypothetical protein ACFQXB_08505 [Plastorhodobacter daqingensis]|uniref:Uncharacterized protein n=1 Tax=Plastorhodobacter daqingensis TaxID=1387281 RepID=A0ABW2UHV9_9RHOB
MQSFDRLALLTLVAALSLWVILPFSPVAAGALTGAGLLQALCLGQGPLL